MAYESVNLFRRNSGIKKHPDTVSALKKKRPVFINKNVPTGSRADYKGVLLREAIFKFQHLLLEAVVIFRIAIFFFLQLQMYFTCAHVAIADKTVVFI